MVNTRTGCRRLTVVAEALGGEEFPESDQVGVADFTPQGHQLETFHPRQTDTCTQTDHIEQIIITGTISLWREFSAEQNNVNNEINDS